MHPLIVKSKDRFWFPALFTHVGALTATFLLFEYGSIRAYEATWVAWALTVILIPCAVIPLLMMAVLVPPVRDSIVEHQWFAKILRAMYTSNEYFMAHLLVTLAGTFMLGWIFPATLGVMYLFSNVVLLTLFKMAYYECDFFAGKRRG